MLFNGGYIRTYVLVFFFLRILQTTFTADSNNCPCGLRRMPRIEGGIETGVNEYPMMAGLLHSESGYRKIYCGASIIARQHVLTAAHCVNGNVSSVLVVIGEHDISTGKETSAAKVFRLDKCIIHSQYDAKTSNNDLAICKIIGTITYSSEVGPVCLPFRRKHHSFVGDSVTALGWGDTEFGGDISPVLRGVSLNIVANCRRQFPKADKSTLCTYSPRKDTCTYDSGGPLLWQNPKTSRLVLAGITSRGVACFIPDTPSLGIRIGDYVDWIESVTPG